jgi:ketosteroid isomerase-like protein
MKKAWSWFGIIGLMLIIGVAIGCSKGGSPSNVVKQFIVAIEKGDAKAIGELATPEAAQIVLMFGEKMKGMVAAKGGITNTKETINGDTAVVEITYKDGSKGEMNLVRVDGKWKVTMEDE